MIVTGYKLSEYRQGYIDAMRKFRTEPKTGRWIKDSLWAKPHCSECGKPCIGVHSFDCVTTDFCPNCGTKMESEVEHD